MTIDFIQQKYPNYCQTLNSNQTIVLSDPETKKQDKAKIKIVALSKSYIITADGGIFPKNQGDKRADFIAYTNKNLYIIELKGKTGIKSAYKQILSTINIVLHNGEFNFFIYNRDKTMACIAGQVNYPKGGSRGATELAKMLVRHSKIKPKNIYDLIVYSRKTKDILQLDS